MHGNESVSNIYVWLRDDFFHLCIQHLDVSQPKGEWKTEDIATVGELLLDVSIQLART